MENKDDNINQVSGNSSRKSKRPYVRSRYLFPVYDMNMALEITNKIDTQGAGTLGEASLAIALGLSAKSSGFQLRIATAKQFGLIERRGSNLYITELAKGILRPVSDKEKRESMGRAFYNVELFEAIGNRFRGVPLPTDSDLRNLLEREFGIKRERVGEAFSVFMKSANTAELLQQSQGKTYLLRETTGVTKQVISQKEEKDGEYLKLPETASSQKVQPMNTWNISIDTKDLVGMDAEAIKATMDGLKSLAETLKQESKENNK